MVAFISLALSGLFVLIPFSFSLFNVSQSLREQYSLTDAFISIQNNLFENSHATEISPKLVIVNVGGIYDRYELCNIFEKVLSANPSVVGLDLMFESPKDSITDAKLTSLIKENLKIVSPCVLTEESGTYSGVKVPFYLEEDSNNAGYVNIIVDKPSETCRQLAPVSFCNGKEFESLPLKMLGISSEKRHTEILSEGPGAKVINYQQAKILTIDASSLEDNLDIIQGKPVIIGDCDNRYDMHATPISHWTPGSEVLAASYLTLLEGSHIRTMSDFGSMVLAFCLSLLLFPLGIPLRKSNLGQAVMPIVQTILIIFLIYVSYVIFVRFDLCIKVIYPVLSIGFIETSANILNAIKRKTSKI